MKFRGEAEKLCYPGERFATIGKKIFRLIYSQIEKVAMGSGVVLFLELPCDIVLRMVKDLGEVLNRCRRADASMQIISHSVGEVTVGT